MQSSVKVGINEVGENKLRFAWVAFGPWHCDSGKLSDQVFEKTSGVLAKG